MFKMVKEDRGYGSLSEFGQFGNGRDGYLLSSLKDVTDLATVMFKYRPYVTWKIRPVLDIDESIVVIQEASATVKLD
jgi:Domain of unknown function (DUF3303)